MAHEPIDFPGWNIFARELQGLLDKRGLRLGHLNDRAGIHPQKVSRLQRSLREPKYSVLSPTDLEKARIAFGFTDGEMLRLRAAILATAIEEVLMDRINQQDALMATQQIFPTLLQAVGKGANHPSGIGAVKGITSVPSLTYSPDQLDTLLDQLDFALLHLHLAADAGRVSRLQHATVARETLLTVMRQLDATPKSADTTGEWASWRDECVDALVAANRFIELSSI